MTPEQLLALLDSFDWKAWTGKLENGITPVYRGLVLVSGQRVLDSFSLDDPFTSRFMTAYLGERITQLEAFTKENVSALMRRVLDERGGGKSPLELATLIRDEVRQHVKGYETWRASRIARTETGYGYNHGTTLAWKQAGGQTVLVTDGDKDEPCAAANGSTWTIDEALANALSHPNCTRAFTPNPDDLAPLTPSADSQIVPLNV